MSTPLERAFAEAQKRDSETQDLIARLILDELADEADWEASFARAPDKLAALAAEAMAETRAGRTELGGFDGR